MKLVTVATESKSYMPFLEESCKRFNADLIILGWGETWTGFSFKFELMIDFLKEQPSDEIICFIDAYDVLLLRPLSELETTFRTLSDITGHNVIFGYDRAPSQLVKIINSAHMGTCHGISLNSGTYIGYAKDLLKIISSCYTYSEADDQQEVIKYANKYPHDIFIDTNSIFFITINNPYGTFMYDKTITVKNKKVLYRGLYPFFAHGNGNTNMVELIEKLGYNIKNGFKNTLPMNQRIIQIKKVWCYFYQYIISLIIIICLIIYVIYKYYK